MNLSNMWFYDKDEKYYENRDYLPPKYKAVLTIVNNLHKIKNIKLSELTDSEDIYKYICQHSVNNSVFINGEAHYRYICKPHNENVFYDIFRGCVIKLIDILTHMINTHDEYIKTNKTKADIYLYTQFMYIVLCIFEIYNIGIVDIDCIVENATLYPYMELKNHVSRRRCKMVDIHCVVCDYFPAPPVYPFYEVYKSYVIELYTKFGIRLNILEFLDTKHVYVFGNPSEKTLNILKNFGIQEKELINECLNKINSLCSLFENENLFYKIMFSDVLRIPKTILENILTFTK